MSNTPSWTPRVLIIVANARRINTGKGGHYYSVREIYSAMSSMTETELCVIGNEIPDALSEIKNVRFLKSSKTVSIVAAWSLRKMISGIQPDVVHCFDSVSLAHTRLALVFRKACVCWTKCGGASLKRYTPRGAPDSVFHAEDLANYRDAVAAPKIIPNRFSIADQEAPRSLSQKLGNPLRFVRISRICKKYKDGLLKTIRFVNELNDVGVSARLDVIGYPEEPDVLAALEEVAGPQIRFLTSPSYTRRASRHLPHYDVAIGGGRSALESIANRLPTMITTDLSTSPILACEANFARFADANFSERALVKATFDESRSDIEEIVNSEWALNRYRDWCGQIYSSYIDVRAGIPLYFEMYSELVTRRTRESVLDIARHVASLLMGVWTKKATKLLARGR